MLHSLWQNLGIHYCRDSVIHGSEAKPALLFFSLNIVVKVVVQAHGPTFRGGVEEEHEVYVDIFKENQIVHMSLSLIRRRILF